MAAKRRTSKKMKAEVATLRTSISFPPEIYRTLEQIAKQHKVSLSWVVRDAVDKYVEDKWPLLMKESSSS